MPNRTEVTNPKSLSQKLFWSGVFIGSMMMLIVLSVIAIMAGHAGPTAGEQLLSCTGDLGMAVAKLNALESRATVIYEPNQAEIPRYEFRNLVEIRPGAALQSPVLRPRWIVLPGETPIDLWKSESVAWAAYNLRTRQIEPPTIVRIEK